MDQSELRELEYRCIQEEWAFCRAACPLHMDARSMCLALQTGDACKARAVVDKTLPVADILGRICEAPCEAACKRNEAGGAVRIGRLEKYCVRSAPRRSKPMKVPDRGRKAAVLGCGLSSLTVASDLARKGYRIQVYHQEAEAVTAVLQALPQPVPAESVKQELDFLQGLGVSFQAATLDVNLLQELLSGPAPVYMGLEAVSAAMLTFSLDQVDSQTLATPQEGLFVGGLSAAAIPRAIDQAWQGRIAAVSMDRVTQKASLSADRGKEGPVPTRLVTSLEGVKNQPPFLQDQAPPGTEEDSEAVHKEAGRCLTCECMICVRSCPFLRAFGSYPKSYARQIYNNESIVKGSHQANTLINSCMLCGMCTALCPNDFPMAQLCLGSRQRMVDRGKMPPSAHDFALKDLDFSRSEDFFLVRGAPDHEQTAWLFFPGCQLCATHPEQVEAAYTWLRDTLDGGVGLALACCGAPAHWGGRQKLFQDAAHQLHSAVQELGNPRWIVACPSCQGMLEHMAPVPNHISLWEVLGLEKTTLQPAAHTEATCLVDPCSASNLPILRQAVRDLIQTQILHEPRLNASEAACCGFGGLVANANPGIAAQAARERAESCAQDALTYCAMCRDQLARSGQRAAHLVDLMFPGRDDPFARPATGLSASRDNRRWLKDRLLQTVWQEPGLAPVDAASIRLIISEQTRQLLEKRRILDSDIQQVIISAKTYGQLFFDPDSETYLASRQLGQVIFWVHYTPQGDGAYLIHTAYSHRMQIRKVSTEEST